jgi:alkylhydroperoxidase family enzyme
MSDLFTDRERVAMRIALVGGASNGPPSREMFAALEDEFSENDVIEIVSIISLFGFLNRWNSLMNTELEALPARYIGDREGLVG